MKTLITAQTVREAQKNGQQTLSFEPSHSIVTPEAKVVAQELGLALVEQGTVSGGFSASPLAIPTGQNQELEKIRLAVLAQLGNNKVPDEVVDQLIQKVSNEQKIPASLTNEGAGTNQAMFTTASGIKRIKGAQIPMGIMEEAGKERQIGLADFLSSADSNSPMAAGFMGWKNCFFPWTLNYDEVDIILEGELHIRCGGETSIAKVGDVIYIPKGSSIEFGTPTSVRFVFVTHPANWLAV